MTFLPKRDSMQYIRKLPQAMKPPMKMNRILLRLLEKPTGKRIFTQQVTNKSGNLGNAARWALSCRVRDWTTPARTGRSFLQHCCLSTTTRVTADDHYEVTIEPTRKLLILQQAAGHRSSFNSTWLRYNCQCPECIQADTGGVLYEPADMKPAYTLQTAETDGDSVKLVWAEDGHSGTIPVSYLRDHDYSDQSRQQAYEQRTPTVVQNNEVPTVTYEEVAQSERGLYSWVQKLNEYGVCVITGAPVDDGTVGKVAEMVWPVQQTIYGELFDVMSTPTPINVAYSDVYLTYHMDIVYYESPPGVQMLHCMRFDECVTGGESLIVDAWAVAEQIKEKHPEYFEVLTRVPATFQKIHMKRDRPVWMKFKRTHIETCPEGNITSVIWSPPFAGPLNVREEDVDMYFKAYHQFAQEVENSSSKLEFRLKEGDILTFNNRRMLHARRGFKLNGGIRHLQGCYMNIDEVQSRVEVLSRKHGARQIAKRAFNQDLR